MCTHCMPALTREMCPLTVFQVLDLYQCRIQAHLEGMSSTLLLNLPITDTWTPDHFLSEARQRCEAGANSLKALSKKVEDSVKELITLLRSSASLPTIHNFDSDETAKSKKGEVFT